MRLAICLCVYEYALEEVCVGRMRVRGYSMRLEDALEIFEGMVKDYRVCVWVLGMRLVDAFALEICVGLMRYCP